MELADHNYAFNLQRTMSPESALLFSQALPRGVMPPDWNAVAKFSVLSLGEPSLYAASEFVHKLAQPFNLTKALSVPR